MPNGQVTEPLFVGVVRTEWTALKTVKREEPIARSRFATCPVCKNHTLKVKKTIRVGRCKNCSETYKIIVVHVKTARKTKPPSTGSESHPTTETNKPSPPPEPVPSLSQPSDAGPLSSTTPDYSGLADAIFGEGHKQQGSESGQSGGQ